jgi:hypothetical protein
MGVDYLVLKNEYLVLGTGVHSTLLWVCEVQMPDVVFLDCAYL